MLDLASDELLTSACQLDEVDLKGTRGHIRHFVGEAAEFGAIGDDLKHGYVQLVEEGGEFGGLGQAVRQLGVADYGGCGLREVDSTRVSTHSILSR